MTWTIEATVTSDHDRDRWAIFATRADGVRFRYVGKMHLAGMHSARRSADAWRDYFSRKPERSPADRPDVWAEIEPAFGSDAWNRAEDRSRIDAALSAGADY
jgi:hypothetical protein